MASKSKILIIEDEVAYVRLLRDELIRNYQVLEAADGQEGLALAKKEHPDLILLDIRMPKMDGMTMLHAMRKDAWGRSAKVIILTNFEADDKILSNVVQDLPAYYFVKSDIDLDALLNKIQDILPIKAS